MNFTKDINFPDGETIPIEFSVEVYEGGFNYEFHGQRGFKKEIELGPIEYEGFGLSDSQIEHLEEILDSKEIEDAAWAAYEKENS